MHRSLGLSHPFAQGALTNLLNPKIALFAIAVLPQFIDVKRGATTITAMNLVTATVAAQARLLISARPRWFERLPLAAGVVLVGLAARIAVERAR